MRRRLFRLVLAIAAGTFLSHAWVPQAQAQLESVWDFKVEERGPEINRQISCTGSSLSQLDTANDPAQRPQAGILLFKCTGNADYSAMPDPQVQVHFTSATVVDIYVKIPGRQGSNLGFTCNAEFRIQGVGLNDDGVGYGIAKDMDAGRITPASCISGSITVSIYGRHQGGCGWKTSGAGFRFSHQHAFNPSLRDDHAISPGLLLSELDTVYWDTWNGASWSNIKNYVVTVLYSQAVNIVLGACVSDTPTGAIVEIGDIEFQKPDSTTPSSNSGDAAASSVPYVVRTPAGNIVTPATAAKFSLSARTNDYASIVTTTVTEGSVNLVNNAGEGDPLTPGQSGRFNKVKIASHDFDGNIKSDILWRSTSGETGMWMMNGAAVASTPSLGVIPTNWSIAGQRDFNSGDGKSDLVWLSSAGDVGIWIMNGASALSLAPLGNVGTSWSIVGTGDFDGNGRADILWRNTSGAVGIWFMDGGTIVATAALGNPGTAWSVVGTGDFNGDGKRDILWRSTANDIGIWYMNGGTIASTASLGNVGAAWSVAGTGDFDGSGRADILWRSTSNDVGIWLINKSSVTPVGLGNVGAAWSVASVGDYDGNGKSDILWRSTSHDIGVWFMNGATLVSAAGLGNVGPTWQVQNAASN